MANLYPYNHWGCVADWCVNMTFKLCLMSVLNLVFPSATMEWEQLFYCHDCENRKPRDQFALCKQTDKHGAMGKPSTRCTSCAENWHWCKSSKQKWVERGTDLCGDPEEPDCTVSLEQFTAGLHEEAITGMISYSACILTEGLFGEVDDICTAIVGHVWEATDFQFTYGWFLLEGQHG